MLQRCLEGAPVGQEHLNTSLCGLPHNVRGTSPHNRNAIPRQNLKRQARVKQLAYVALATIGMRDRIKIRPAFAELVARHEQAFAVRVAYSVKLSLLGVRSVMPEAVSV